MNNSLIQEAKEEARKDNLTKFFTKNKNLIFAIFCALFVILVV